MGVSLGWAEFAPSWLSQEHCTHPLLPPTPSILFFPPQKKPLQIYFQWVESRKLSVPPPECDVPFPASTVPCAALGSRCLLAQQRFIHFTGIFKRYFLYSRASPA